MIFKAGSFVRDVALICTNLFIQLLSLLMVIFHHVRQSISPCLIYCYWNRNKDKQS